MNQLFTLDNGPRIVLIPSATDVVYAGIAVAAGTRHELDTESGMAHLVEHMTFKGTPHLSSVQILNRMESVGGDLNAYTGKEETIYYATFLRQHLRRAVPLLLDIVFNSTYPQEELEKEREVVIDEIESYNDSPAELIYDDFEALLFAGHPLGRSILGDASLLRRHTAEDLRRFVRRNYRADRAVLFVKGNVGIGELCRTLPRPCRCQPAQPSDHPAAATSLAATQPAATTVLDRHTHQTHVLMGARAYAATDPRHIGLCLLSNLLGGPAMNSRLSLALRERTGLVYTVESTLTAYTDTGVWGVYFGCDHGDLDRCRRLVRRELQRLCEAPLAPRTLVAAKRQLKGQLGVGADNFESVALAAAKHYLHSGRLLSLEQRLRQIDDLDSAQLHAIALEVMNPDRLTTLIYQ